MTALSDFEIRKEPQSGTLVFFSRFAALREALLIHGLKHRLIKQ
jgi:hypothetical protein